MIPILTEVMDGAQNVEIVNENFLRFDTRRAGARFKLVGNLPYYITTPIIAKMLEAPVKPERMVFMVQKEVAERIAAAPGSRIYGAISVLAQYYSRVTYLTDVSKEVFLPKPQVDSSVIILEPKPFADETPIAGEKPIDAELFFSIIHAGFGQRRKMLRNALGGLLGLDRERLERAFTYSGIDPARRAETLGVEEFIALANAIFKVARTRQSDSIMTIQGSDTERFL
jgi:16S rRNA (adenine1518-N6/adenine1519-N6)-dimethyltransferase